MKGLIKIPRNGFSRIIEGSKTQKREQGDVLSYDKDRRCGFILNTKNQKVFFPIGNIKPDNALSRAWAMICGTPLTYVVAVRETKNGLRRVAMDIEPLFPHEAVDLESLREVSTVISMSNGFGFALRPDGDQIFFHKAEVVPDFLSRWRFLKKGAPIYHGIMVGSDGLPRCSSIELYSLKEIESEPVPEPELASVPAQTSFESELLAPTFRSKTLREIIEEKKHGKTK